MLSAKARTFRRKCTCRDVPDPASALTGPEGRVANAHPVQYF
jgi:hypothetical protein